MTLIPSGAVFLSPIPVTSDGLFVVQLLHLEDYFSYQMLRVELQHKMEYYVVLPSLPLDRFQFYYTHDQFVSILSAPTIILFTSPFAIV